ncbi:NadD Nicotinic acid mononucleotide adenylyltransferase [Fimbriimonadaceae bacterium]
MKIGILGGTFDPPHVGHLKIALTVHAALDLDEVLLLPANQNPLKQRRSSASSEHRLAMVQTMISKHESLSLSDMEITRGGMSYTVDTLGELSMIRQAEFWFIMGTDGLATIGEWKGVPRLAKMCRLAIVLRPPITQENALTMVPEVFQDKCDFVQMDPMEVSSTEIRDRIARRKPVTDLVTPEVLRYIQEKRLYTDS